MSRIEEIESELARLTADVQLHCQRRREAHGNNEEQNLINHELTACYEQQAKLWKEKNRLLKK